MSEYEKVQKLITEADELISKQVTAEDTEFGIWEYKVKKYIIEKFGDKSFEMNAFDDINFSLLNALDLYSLYLFFLSISLINSITGFVKKLPRFIPSSFE